MYVKKKRHNRFFFFYYRYNCRILKFFNPYPGHPNREKGKMVLFWNK